jgi:predicted phage tail protein
MNADRVSVRTVARKGGGKGGNQQSQHQPTEAANTLRSRSTARIIEVLSEGIIEGLATGDLQSVFLDKTPIQNPDGSTNFTVPESYFRDGSPDQDPVPGFPAAEAEMSVGVEMQYAVPVVRRVSPGLSAVRYKVRVSGLYAQESDGDVSPTGVDYTMEYRVGTGGAWVQAVAEQIYGKTMSPYERAVRVDLPVTDDIVDIRLTRTTPPPPDSSTQNQIYFSTYTEIIDVRLKYDDTALAAMVVDSQYFPNVPLRGYLIRGIRCDVPSNYDPVARTYTGYF